ncbi:MAG: hypothetical protein ACRCU5_01350 [Rhizobiaceae bacterium]
MNKIIIALGIALISATSAFAQSSALDVVNQKFEYNASEVDTAPTGSVGTAADIERARFGDGSPAFQGVDTTVDGAATGSVAPAPVIEYNVNDRLGGNS